MAGKDIPCDYFTVLVKNGPKVKSKSLESIELQKTLAQVAEDTGIGTESIDIYASEKEICDTPTHVKDMTIIYIEYVRGHSAYDINTVSNKSSFTITFPPFRCFF